MGIEEDKVKSDEAMTDSNGQPEMTLEAMETLEKALAEEREKSAEHWNRLLHKEAELQNFARRARQELENAKKYGADGLASDLITVLDSLDQGIETAPNHEQAKPVVDGLMLVRKAMLDTLKKYGVTLIDPQNQPFNHEFHEAISIQPNTEVPPNTILIVAQKGYMLHDRLLRPARVIVSSADASNPSTVDEEA